MGFMENVNDQLGRVESKSSDMIVFSGRTP